MRRSRLSLLIVGALATGCSPNPAPFGPQCLFSPGARGAEVRRPGPAQEPCTLHRAVVGRGIESFERLRNSPEAEGRRDCLRTAGVGPRGARLRLGEGSACMTSARFASCREDELITVEARVQ